jgi:hypothetical protein
VAVLGGMIGLGGAEFGLPILIGMFALSPPRRAHPLWLQVRELMIEGLRYWYEADSPPAHRFRYGLLVFDVVTVIFVVASSFTRDACS